MLNLSFESLHSLNPVFYIFEEVEHLAEVRHIKSLICFLNAGSHSVVKIRYGLSTVLVILIRLNRNACKCCVAFDVVWLSQVPVSGRKSVFEQFYQVNLAAGHRQRIEVHIVNMDVAFFVGFGMLRVDNIHLVEFLGTLGTVLQHCSHCCISVYVCVFTLDFVFFCFFKSQILINLHEFGVHVSDSGTFRTVKYVFFRCAGMSVFNQNFLNSILNLFYRRYLIMADFQ